MSIEYFTDTLTGGWNYVYSSTEGGKVIYIYGEGFDATASNNKVTFGNDPCIVKDGGASNNLITCVTSKPSSSQNSTYGNMVLNVTVGKRTVSFPAYNLNFNEYLTPEITRLIPRNPYPGQ